MTAGKRLSSAGGRSRTGRPTTFYATAAYKGFREDKPAREVTRGTAHA